MKFPFLLVRLGVGITLMSWLLTTSAQAEDANRRVRIIRIPGVNKIIKAQSGPDGTIHLVFDGNGGPYYVRSRDSGVTFSAAVPVVNATAQKPGLNFSVADLAVGQDGRVHVALSSDAWRLKLPQEEWSLHYAVLEPDADTFSPLRNLNRKPSEGFSLAADVSGNITACFLSGKLFAMVSRDNGATFASFSELNPAWNPCDCCTTSAAYGADGRLALFYREETNNERDMFVVIWDQKRGTKTRSRVGSTSWKINGCPMTYYSIHRAGTGYVAAWPTQDRVYFARLDKAGSVLPPGEIATPGTHGMRTGLLALTARDGATLVAWKNKEALGWQLYDENGQPKGTPGSAESSGNGAAGVVLPNDDFALFP